MHHFLQQPHFIWLPAQFYARVESVFREEKKSVGANSNDLCCRATQVAKWVDRTWSGISDSVGEVVVFAQVTRGRNPHTFPKKVSCHYDDTLSYHGCTDPTAWSTVYVNAVGLQKASLSNLGHIGSEHWMEFETASALSSRAKWAAHSKAKVR